MKKQLLLLAVISALFASSSFAETTVKAKVNDAVVFLSGAELRQQAVVNLQQGENEVRVEGLAPYINRESLKIALNDGVILSSYSYSIDYLTEQEPSKRVKALEDSVAYYTNKERDIKSELQTTNDMLSMLKVGMNTALTPSQQQLTTEAIEKNLQFFRNRQLQLNTDIKNLEQKQKKAADRRKDFQRQLDEERQQSRQQCGVATLQLNAAKAGKCNIELSYFTSSASWTPFYDMQIKKPQEPVSLMMKAYVRQTTGMNWEKVNLVLSTGQPARQHDAPKLDTWFLRQQHYYASGARLRATESYAMMDAMPMEEDAEESLQRVAAPIRAEKNTSIEEYVEAEEQSLSREYKINLPYTIEGNGKKRTISLFEQQIKADNTSYTYFIVPKLDGGAYLTLDIAEWQSLNLLNGTVNITNNNVFYGQSQINTSTTDKLLTLTIGEDKQIAVKRELLQDFSQTKTIGSNKTTVKAYKITVTNNKKETVKIRLQEPYPVSTEKNINVELLSQTTPATTNDKEHGILTYELELAAGASESITVGYSVKYPKDSSINL